MQRLRSLWLYDEGANFDDFESLEKVTVYCNF